MTAQPAPTTAPADVGQASPNGMEPSMATTEQLVDRLGVVMEEVLAELKHLRSDLAERSASVSSVEIDSNGKAGETKIKIKKYTDSQPPVDETLEDFAFGMREIQRLQMANWAETADGLAGALNGGGKA